VFLAFATLAKAQSLEGLWNTGMENTIVKIKKTDNAYVGEVESSDNPQAAAGKIILKNIKKSDENYEGEIFVMKKQDWFNAKLDPKIDELVITVSAGIFKKIVKWKKIN
jgi:uncharacterized protein (DUF2147 family)